jgi:hypothetical protein
MGWPYEFVQLTAEQQHESRVLLDQYGTYGQFSAFLLIVFLLLIRLSQWLVEIATANGTVYDAVPISEAKRQTAARSLSPKLRQALWWLDYDMEVAGVYLGRRDELLFGVGWTAWLLFLCINQTGNGISSPPLGQRELFLAADKLQITFTLPEGLLPWAHLNSHCNTCWH